MKRTGGSILMFLYICPCGTAQESHEAFIQSSLSLKTIRMNSLYVQSLVLHKLRQVHESKIKKTLSQDEQN